MDRRITIRRSTVGKDGSGGATQGWSDLATIRAQMLQSSTAEFMEAGGEKAERTVAFRARWMPGVRNADRILFEGEAFEIVEIKEIGRRRGIELRCKVATS